MTTLHTTAVLKQLLPDLKFWDYGNDFDQLWRMDLSGTDRAIVVWADTPPDPEVSPVSTDEYVTPFDWAIAACTLDPGLRVTVIDLRPGEHDDKSGYAVQPTEHSDKSGYAALRWLRTQKPECVPWVRRVVMHDLLDASDADRIKSLLISDPTPRNGSLEVRPGDALQRLPVCHVDVTRDASHHAIANLVGPLLLIRKQAHEAAVGVAVGVGSANHREALRQLLLTAGLAPNLKLLAGEDGTVAKLGNVRIILVDDQWHHGWAEWLCQRLGLAWDKSRAKAACEPAKKAPQCVAGKHSWGVSLWVSSAPQWLLERARAALDGKPRDARFELRLTDGDGKSGEILLLDLRLLPPEGSDEKNFVREVASLTRRFTASSALPPLAETELRGIEKWSSTDDGKDTDRTASVLTLLPRFLAHVDLSLPIVLFSSTGRRDIVDKLRGYGSILTQFSKPLFFGRSSLDVAEQAEETLEAALSAAHRLAVARKLCQRIARAATKQDPVTRRASKDITHFELYLDESGSGAVATDQNAKKPERKRFVVAGLLVGYSSVEGWLDLDGRMATRGLRWWPDNLGDPYLTKDNRINHDDLDGAIVREEHMILDQFLECLDGTPAYGICLEYGKAAEKVSPDDELRSLWDNDNRYRFVLSTLLEVLLFDVLPTIVSNDDATISIFVATRVRKFDEFSDERNAIRRYQEIYGYYGSDDSHFRSFTDDAVLPVLLEVFERRSGYLPSAVQMKHYIRGVTLKYPKTRDWRNDGGPWWQPKWRNTRHQHYLADIVAGLCRETGANVQTFGEGGLSKMFESGVYDVTNDRFLALLNAARARAKGDCPGALVELAKCDFGPKFEPESSGLLLLQQFEKMIHDDLTGEEFTLLARRLNI